MINIFCCIIYIQFFFFFENKYYKLNISEKLICKLMIRKGSKFAKNKKIKKYKYIFIYMSKSIDIINLILCIKMNLVF